MTEIRTMSEVGVLKQYFDLLPGQTLSQFTAELKALGPENKRELAELAAKELGVQVKVKLT